MSGGEGCSRGVGSAGEAVEGCADLVCVHRVGRQRAVQHQALDEGVELAGGDRVEVPLEAAPAALHPVLRDAAQRRAAALEALVEHLTGDLLGSGRDLVLAVELYTAAARNPALRAVTQDWMSRSRRSLERHLDPVTAREVDALVEGLVLHSALSTDPMDATQIRSALHRLAG